MNKRAESLSRRTKLLYGVGDVGFSVTTTMLAAYFGIFLTDVVGLSPAHAATAVFIGRSWDYINDPLIGHFSDRTRTRWGRRRPFLLFGALPFALTFMLLWWVPPVTGDLARIAYYTLAYLLFEAAATFVYMPYFALTPELTTSYDERTALTSYRMFFSIAGSLIAFTLPLTLVGTFTPENAPRVLRMGLVFGIVSAGPLLLTFLGTRERPRHMTLEQPNLRSALRAAWQNRPFVFSMGIFLLTWVAIDIIQSSLLYYIKYWLGMETQSDLIMGVIFITAIAALPLWEWASRRWSKRWAYVVGIAFWAVMQIILVVVGPETGFAAIIALCVLAGIGVAAAHVLPWAMIPDTIEWGEWQTDERHEGMLYSLVTLIKKGTSSLAIPLTLVLLELTGYVPNAPQQSPGALNGIRLMIGPLPALMLCAGIVLAIKYPLTREQYTQVVQALEQRRGAALKENP
jgi:GPH family glycoside/pentoside/hexuronide:cation symporter